MAGSAGPCSGAAGMAPACSSCGGTFTNQPLTAPILFSFCLALHSTGTFYTDSSTQQPSRVGQGVYDSIEKYRLGMAAEALRHGELGQDTEENRDRVIGEGAQATNIESL